jgi:hypothetical protein
VIYNLQPLEKRHALVFYAQIRNTFMLLVDEDNWISLGYRTAANLESQQQLACAYGALVEQCHFDEFWNAMAESRMVELFEKYGLSNRILHMRNFRDFIVIVKKWHQSVWQLKRFTCTSVADPFRAAAVDYGFVNCENARQRIQLPGIYKEYFERGEDEMKLHEACVAGKLASFLKSVLGSLLVPPDILQNGYPRENSRMAGMVTDKVIQCPASALDSVKALPESEGNEIIVISDADDNAMVERIHHRAAFLGAGLRKRYYAG